MTFMKKILRGKRKLERKLFTLNHEMKKRETMTQKLQIFCIAV